jgi:[acyl-carrier-protein] S-malonyltransferase
MGRSLWERSAVARELFAQADVILGVPLASLCFTGPEPALRRTENAQPALFTVSVIESTLLRERDVVPAAAAGHSAGEYAALVTAGALSFEDGLRLVRRRGELMAEQCERVPGAMAAIVGLPIRTVEMMCAAARETGHVEVANENAADQTVVSGEVAAVERVMDLVESHEGGLALPLAVAGAFHSRLMASVARDMAAALDDVPLRPASIPVVANVNAGYVTTPDEIRAALIGQVDQRVRWSASMQRLAVAGATRFIVAGPSRALIRLTRRNLPDAMVLAAEDLLAATASAEPLR